MKIIDMLKVEDILVDLRSDNKGDVLRELVQPFVESPRNLDSEATVHALHERERLGSTGIGDGIAIPHGKIPGLDELVLSFGRSAAGIPFDAMDGKPVHLFFLLIAPENSAGLHLKALAKISKMLKDGVFRTKLMTARTREDLYKIIAVQDDQIS
ncbi:MAG: PTS system fructose-specific EIIABC component [Syntrophaceae bacterium PtaB.Bin095]|jgi:PTS system nitrogen regulatory IIA component|nr:MAG: PTS system fructose-specific EIIABC component [Syntrophaceae bacterium PtaB.Bin095]